jgi:hypothetical protein
VDNPNQFENPGIENNQEGDNATRRIDPSELNTILEPEEQTGASDETVVVTPAPEAAATIVLSANQEDMAPAKETAAPPKPTIPQDKPAPSMSTTTSPKDNRTSIIAIIAVAVIALFCICACTAIAITALMVAPTY